MMLRSIPPTGPLEGATEAPVRVLVVEDEPLYADQLEALLRRMGYELVGPAINAQTALALYRTEAIDLALLDIGLRGPVNGIELARQLLAHRAVPLIFLTAFADEETFQQAQAAGPAAYLTKPIDEEALRRAISLAVSKLTAAAWPHEPRPAASPLLVTESVFIKEDGLLERVMLNDIYSVAADNKTCTLVLAERSVSVRMPLRELAQYLPAERFVQIQRSYFVNVTHIERLDPTSHLVQVGKQLLPVGRLYLPELLNRLQTIP